jgi:hypothetical protein
MLAVADEAGTAIVEREGATAVVGLPHRAAHGMRRRRPTERNATPGMLSHITRHHLTAGHLTAEGWVLAKVESGPDGEFVHVGELGGRGKTEAHGWRRQGGGQRQAFEQGGE